MTDRVPEWARDALAATPVEHDVLVDGANVRYRTWDQDCDEAPLLLVHGGLAHGQWWDHVAPLLPASRVVTIDLSGHGDSGHRNGYDAIQWAREIAGVIADARLSRPILVGHSMGGQPALVCATTVPHLVGGIILVDSRFNDVSYPPRDKPSRTYASLDDGTADFDTVHEAPGVSVPKYLLRHVAETGLIRNGETWRWKRDDRYHVAHTSLRDFLPHLHQPLAIVRTEFGLVSAEMAAEMRQLVAGPSVEVEIRRAGHNPMLEQPLAFVMELRTLLSEWFPSVPAASRL